MKYFLIVSTVLFCCNARLHAQKFYTTSGGEVIFQTAIVESNGENLNTNLRFSMAFHFGEFVHFDFGENVGIFSGIALRNVGLITDEEDIKTKFRSYNLGIPLALKIGSFKKNLYVFGGAEYEWMFHFKQKTFRNGTKYKKSAWFGEQTPTFIPSAFAGIQFPQGIQLKFKYYLGNFLNHKYNEGPYENYTLLNKSQIWYLSVSYIIRNKKKEKSDSKPIDMATL